MISFIRNLLGVKTDQAVQSAVEALVRWDPKSATEAELRTMEEHLDQLGLQVAQPAQQVFGEPARVLADLDHLVDGGEHAVGVSGGETRP